MSNLIYANIGDSGECLGMVEYQQFIEPTDSMILIESFDEALLNQRWTGEAWEKIPTTDETARQWRDNELLQTDWIIPVSDHPQHAAYITYRAALRAWPTASDFPTTRADLNAAAKAASLAEGGAGALANAAAKAVSLAEGGAGALANAAAVAQYHIDRDTTAGEDAAVDADAAETGVAAGETQAVADGIAAGETQAVADGIAAEVGANQPEVGS